jgi:hypothetical protein
MKYSHDWMTKYNELPYYLQKRCINYKKWKKNKNTDMTYLKNALNKEYDYIDKFIQNICEENVCSCLPIFNKKYKDSDIYKFLILNKECLRKLTKRLDKKNQTNIMSKWYSVKLSQAGFIGGFHIEHLRLKIYGLGNENECPICFEEFKDKVCIFDCSHRVCEPCVRELYDIKNTRGSIEAIASYRLYHRDSTNIPVCPICRYKYPIRFTSRCHIIEI